MKLLIISNNPSRASFRQRIGIYQDTLRKNGIDCEVAKLPGSLLARRETFIRAAEFDGVFLHKKKLNFFDASRLRRCAKKIIYDFDDAVMFDPDEPQRLSLSHLIPFRRTVKLADLVIAGNKYLAGYARKFNNNVEVLPTGLDLNAYQVKEKSASDGKIRLVWIGSKSTLRYLTEIKPAIEEIGSRFENVILRIICDDFFELKNMPVEKHHWSEGAQAHDLATSDIGLAPLPDNNFTRGKCGFKILQYEAAALPVVASPTGVNADYVADNRTGYHASNPQQWIEKTGKLIENAQLRRQMGQEGFKHAKNFNTEIIGQRLQGLIRSCLGEKIA